MQIARQISEIQVSFGNVKFFVAVGDLEDVIRFYGGEAGDYGVGATNVCGYGGDGEGAGEEVLVE